MKGVAVARCGWAILQIGEWKRFIEVKLCDDFTIPGIIEHAIFKPHMSILCPEDPKEFDDTETVISCKFIFTKKWLKEYPIYELMT